MIGLDKIHNGQAFIDLLEKFHYPLPFHSPYLIGGLQMVLAVLLFIGFASRLVGILITAMTLTALATLHMEQVAHFRFITDPLMLVAQEPYPFLITGIMVFVFGPGWISIDAWFKRWISQQPRY
jgi:uncharacterized membrane protein YphA (DoxX/SURF4 family)